jgi:hypothetical protein
MDAGMLFLLPNAPVKCTLNTFTVILFNDSDSTHHLLQALQSMMNLGSSDFRYLYLFLYWQRGKRLNVFDLNVSHITGKFQ